MFSITRCFWHIKKSFDALASPHITLIFNSEEGVTYQNSVFMFPFEWQEFPDANLEAPRIHVL